MNELNKIKHVECCIEHMCKEQLLLLKLKTSAFTMVLANMHTKIYSANYFPAAADTIP